MEDYRAQLLAAEAKLAKDPENQELLQLKADLTEAIELCGGLEEEKSDSQLEPSSSSQDSKNRASTSSKFENNRISSDPGLNHEVRNGRSMTDAELLARKKQKNKKKKAKLRERLKEQSDLAESEKKSWQSFANKKGLKGVTKKSIFASPCSVAGKVGVGTNGIADAPSATIANVKSKRKF